MKLAIDLGGTNIRIGQIEDGQIRSVKSISCHANQPFSEVITQIICLVEAMITPNTEGIGVGVPSVVDAEKGIIYNVMNIPSWREVHLKAILAEIFHLPISINNDANCFVLGEKLYGEGKGTTNLIGVTLGTGVGTGVIINGQLYNGRNTGAGEIGSLSYLTHNFEYYCSGSFFTREHNMTGKEAFERATKGEKEALEVWNEIGIHIGHLMEAILFTYDPEIIIIGGGISAGFPYFAPAMNNTLLNFPYEKTVEKIKILPTKKEYISLLGASALLT
ncbi:MAG: ROK family protein [Bacteroides sp.]